MPDRFIGHTIVFLLLLGLAAVPVRGDCATRSAVATEVDLEELFTGMEGAFVLFDPGAGTIRRYNAARAAKQFLPASTFKIPSALIALETGVASGPDFAISWNQATDPAQEWWPASWKRDQTLESAIRNSVVWYFEEIYRRVGEETMKKWVDRFGYGNRAVSAGAFWLRGDLRISPDEQVEFLCRFNEGLLGVSTEATDAVRQMIVLAEEPGFRLSGKTGTADVTKTRELGWLVGYVERGRGIEYFALNMEGERVWEDWPPANRKDLVKSILERMEESGR